jgi:acetyl-CoA C-acetyltransferase
VVSRTPVIVGVGTSKLPKAPDLDAVDHHVLAAQRALTDCGLRLADIDGYCCAGASQADVAPDDMEVMVEYLGLSPTFTDSTMTGGSSFEIHVEHAAAAIKTGGSRWRPAATPRTTPKPCTATPSRWKTSSRLASFLIRCTSSMPA